MANTGPTSIERRNEKGQVAWIVRGESSRVRFSADGDLGGEIANVEGQMFAAGKAANRFRAKAGRADQDRNRLVLVGEVRIEDLARGAILTADRVVYDGAKEQIEASGTVKVLSESYSMGPFETLLATPDLSDIGTPDRFGDRSR